jgi:endonuclease III
MQHLGCLQVADIENIVEPIGLAKTKARNLSGMARIVSTTYGKRIFAAQGLPVPVDAVQAT